jgi:ABC-type lipoprotein export system ATPase subunit
MIGSYKLTNSSTGQLATLSEVGKEKYLIIQLQCPTRSISQNRINEVVVALRNINAHLGDRVLIVGHDVDVYQLTGEQATLLRLEGVI